MTALLAASLSLLMIFTALLSGVFGMAGGLILVGVLLVVMPLPQAMVLHAVTQMASNGWRALLWRQHIVWKTAAASTIPCRGTTDCSNLIIVSRPAPHSLHCIIRPRSIQFATC